MFIWVHPAVQTASGGRENPVSAHSRKRGCQSSLWWRLSQHALLRITCQSTTAWIHKYQSCQVFTDRQTGSRQAGSRRQVLRLFDLFHVLTSRNYCQQTHIHTHTPEQVFFYGASLLTVFHLRRLGVFLKPADVENKCAESLFPRPRWSKRRPTFIWSHI